MTLHRFAVLAALLTLLLLSWGGVVTSRDAGMVFEDWPLSEGSLNPDGWVTNADKRAEHGHRILGSLVGLATIVLAFWLQKRETRRFMRVLGWVALVFVSLQGLLGGLRVTEDDGLLALIHGCTGQLYFGLMVALAYLTSKDGREAPEGGSDVRFFFGCCVAVTLTVFAQVILGAQLRHNGGPLNTHLLGAALVSISVFWVVTVALLRHGDRPALRRTASLLAGMLLAQVALGFISAQALVASREYDLARVMLPTTHQSLGAVMLATCIVLTLRTFRRIGSEHAVEAFA